MSIDSIVKGEADEAKENEQTAQSEEAKAVNELIDEFEGKEEPENKKAEERKFDMPLSAPEPSLKEKELLKEQKDEKYILEREKEREERKKEKKRRSWLFPSYPILAVIAYCLIGVFLGANGWKIGWIVLLTIPLFYTSIIAIEKKKPVIFCYPVLVLIVFLLLGFAKSLWHPSWILFLTIPIFYIIVGLGANALNEDAVKNIYKAKGRPSDNPLIVHIANKEDIVPLVKEVTPKAQALIDAFFPGPLTIILPKSDLIGKVVSGGLDTVAVRMPINEVANKVIKAAGCPIAAPSANTSGLPSPTRAKYVIDDMSGKIEAIIDGGDCEFGVESTVITLATDIPTVLRPGAVTKEMLEGVIGEVEVANAVLHGMKDNETAASKGEGGYC